MEKKFAILFVIFDSNTSKKLNSEMDESVQVLSVERIMFCRVNKC